MAKQVTNVTEEMAKEWGRVTLLMEDAGLKPELHDIASATSKNWERSTHKDWNISYIWGINKMKELLEKEHVMCGAEEYEEIMKSDKLIRKLKK